MNREFHFKRRNTMVWLRIILDVYLYKKKTIDVNPLTNFVKMKEEE